MRIGITCYPTYGGSGVVATELGIELAAMGHEVHFISYSQPFRLSGRDQGIFYHEVPVSSYPLFEFPPYDLALASRMAEVAEFNGLDLLHVHYAIPHSVSALLARQMLAARGRRLPFVTTLHGTDITLVGLDRSYLPITRYAIQESDGVTSISTYLKEKTVQDFDVTRGIEVIPNFVNCDVYTPIKDEPARAEARRRLGAEGIVGTFGGSRELVPGILQAPVDYWAIGPVYATTTKQTATPPIGPEGVRRLREMAGPEPVLVAVGGVTFETARLVLKSGASSVGVAAALFGKADPAGEFRRWVSSLN